MRTHCERHGQTEVGIVEHEGNEFSALGASVVGSHITGYTRSQNGQISLTTWGGETLLDARSEVVEQYSDGSLTLMFRLPKGRFVVGYALADHGMLFRGELVTEGDEEDARATAVAISDYFAELDAEDELLGEEAA